MENRREGLKTTSRTLEHTALLFASPRDRSKAQAIRQSMGQAQGGAQKKFFVESAAHNEIVKLNSLVAKSGLADSRLLEQEVHWGRRCCDSPASLSSIRGALSQYCGSTPSSSQRSGRTAPSNQSSLPGDGSTPSALWGRTERAPPGKHISWAPTEKSVKNQPGTSAQPPCSSPTPPAKAREKDQLLESGNDKQQGPFRVSTPRRTRAATPQPESIPAGNATARTNSARIGRSSAGVVHVQQSSRPSCSAETPEQNAAIQPVSIPASHDEAKQVKDESTEPGEMRPPDENLEKNLRTWWRRAVSQKRRQRAEVRARSSNEHRGPAGASSEVRAKSSNERDGPSAAIYRTRWALAPLHVSPEALRKALTLQADSLAGPGKPT